MHFDEFAGEYKEILDRSVAAPGYMGGPGAAAAVDRRAPQLVNVIRGDMSLVGPRPLPLRDVSRFSEPALMRRFSVYPGITGLWQVSGRSELGFEDRIRLDLQYIDEWSLTLEARILLATVPTVLRGAGAV